MKAYWKSLRSYDMFGHLITMNFNKKGSRHNTQIGAMFSLLIKFFIYVYIGLTFKTLLFKGANKNGTTNTIEPITDFGKVAYADSGFRAIYVLR